MRPGSIANLSLSVSATSSAPLAISRFKSLFKKRLVTL